MPERTEASHTPDDLAPVSVRYQDATLQQQYQQGLVSRLEADLADLLARLDVHLSPEPAEPPVSTPLLSPVGATGGTVPRLVLHQLTLSCFWHDVPMLRDWLTTFLAQHQPTAHVVATGMTKEGIHQMVTYAPDAIEAFVVIGSMQSLHGKAAEQAAQHLVETHFVISYHLATIPLLSE